MRQPPQVSKLVRHMEQGSIRWFGRKHSGFLYETDRQVPTPEGCECVHCKETVEFGDDGIVYAGGEWDIAHRECFVRAIIGSAQHQEGRCTCYIADAPDEEAGLTRREAAQAALKAMERRKR